MGFVFKHNAFLCVKTNLPEEERLGSWQIGPRSSGEYASDRSFERRCVVHKIDDLQDTECTKPKQ